MQKTGLEQILPANRPILLRFLRARLGDDQESEDCFQDLWIMLHSADTGPDRRPAPCGKGLIFQSAADARRPSHRCCCA
jgi:DNA-directed RNA polymerase specialized sigma24 family protein